MNKTNNPAQANTFVKSTSNNAEQSADELMTDREIQVQSDAQPYGVTNEDTKQDTHGMFLNTKGRILSEKSFFNKDKRPVQYTAIPSLLERLEKNIRTKRRNKSRDAFELYDDQKLIIDDIIYMYKKERGERISKSFILRESLDSYLPVLLKNLTQKTD